MPMVNRTGFPKAKGTQSPAKKTLLKFQIMGRKFEISFDTPKDDTNQAVVLDLVGEGLLFLKSTGLNALNIELEAPAKLKRDK